MNSHRLIRNRLQNDYTATIGLRTGFVKDSEKGVNGDVNEYGHEGLESSSNGLKNSAVNKGDVANVNVTFQYPPSTKIEDVVNVRVWVKLHGILVTAFSKDSLSVSARKLGTPLMLDSYTSNMCSNISRFSMIEAMIKASADLDLERYYRDKCPKNLGSDVAKNRRILAKLLEVCSVGPKVGFKPVKQVYIPISKKNNVNTSAYKKKDVESTKEVSNPNPFDVLNLVENDVDLVTNGGTSNLASKEANSSGSSFWNVVSSSISTTPIVDKNDKLEKLIIDERITLVDDEGKPLKKG
ncbi:hypothetical protein Tco_0341534 [Tanacetum coccineum]